MNYKQESRDWSQANHPKKPDTPTGSWTMFCKQCKKKTGMLGWKFKQINGRRERICASCAGA